MAVCSSFPKKGPLRSLTCAHGHACQAGKEGVQGQVSSERSEPGTRTGARGRGGSALWWVWRTGGFGADKAQGGGVSALTRRVPCLMCPSCNEARKSSETLRAPQAHATVT